MKAFAAAILLSMTLGACATAAQTHDADMPATTIALETVAITTMLDKQGDDWNRGDVDAFMEGYWKSPDLRFASGGDVTRGWKQTNARYKKSYATPEKMGTLSFTDLEVNLLAEDAAVVHGRWALKRTRDNPGGLYTLILRKFGDDWKIISDTTTSAQ